MSKSEDKLNDIFDLPKQIKQEFNNEIVPELVSPKPVISETESEKLQNELEPIIDKEDVDNDYENARKNFYSLINKGNTAIDGILNLAKESEHQSKVCKVASTRLQSRRRIGGLELRRQRQSTESRFR